MTIFFWKNWTRQFQSTWYVAAAGFVIALLFMWHGYFKGNNAIIHWEKLQEQKSVESIVHTFTVGPFELIVPAENFVIYEYFHGSSIEPNTIAALLFLLLLGISAVLLLAVITTLDRFWFVVGMVLFILFLYSLRLKVLTIFGQLNQIPFITVCVLITTPSVYFNMIGNNVNFRNRVLVLSSMVLLMVVAIYFFSDVTHPFFHLAVTAYPSAFILTLLFIILVSHEIVASFIYLLSRSGSGTNNLKHFSIIVTIYLANLTITALHEIGSLDWNFIYINLLSLTHDFSHHWTLGFP
jgi:hypothetical protein